MWKPWSVGFCVTACCGLTWKAAKHHTTICSLIQSRIRERTRNKTEHISWHKRYSIRQKRKIGEKCIDDSIYLSICNEITCSIQLLANWCPASNTVSHHLPINAQQHLSSGWPLDNSQQLHILLHDVTWYGVTTCLLQATCPGFSPHPATAPWKWWLFSTKQPGLASSMHLSLSNNQTISVLLTMSQLKQRHYTPVIPYNLCYSQVLQFPIYPN